MTKVSIIIPVYNVERYLRVSLESVVNQTLEDIEIICVNDGSTDGSLEILNEFAKKDKRIILINQENQGLSGARNTGLNVATGEYIAFLDSDDWVDTNFLENLYNTAKKYESDIAVATIIRKREKHQKYRVKYDKEQVVQTLEDKINICDIPHCCYVWNKIYRSDLIKNTDFKVGVFFEDMLWSLEVIKQSNSIVTVPNTNYYYRVNKISIVKALPTIQKQDDKFNSSKYIIEFFKENNLKLSKKYQFVTKRIYYWLGFSILKIKEYKNHEVFLLFGILPIFMKKA